MAARSTSHRKKTVSADPSYRKKKPLEYLPVQRSMYIAPISGASSTGIIDGARLLSTSNNRLYRFGKRYNMKVDIDVNALTDSSGALEVWALADSWAVQKAFAEAKFVFDKAYENERENLSKEARARWFDFRIASGVAGDTMFATRKDDPNDATATLLTGGEFESSIVVDQAGVTRSFTWARTATASQYSLPTEYDLSGNTNPSPTTATGSGPYADLQADSSAVEMQALQDRGNEPPYEKNSFPQVWVKIATLATSSGLTANGARKLSTGFFDAPCGLVVLRSIAAGSMADLTTAIKCEFKSGDYKGVRAHNMERM